MLQKVQRGVVNVSLDAACRKPYNCHMRSKVFNLTTVELAGTREDVLRGGRHLFPLLPEALHDAQRLGVIGWGPQARAQAMNLRESLAGTGIDITFGLRSSS